MYNRDFGRSELIILSIHTMNIIIISMAATTVVDQRVAAAKDLRDIQKALGQDDNPWWRRMHVVHRGKSSLLQAHEKPTGERVHASNVEKRPYSSQIKARTTARFSDKYNT